MDKSIIQVDYKNKSFSRYATLILDKFFDFHYSNYDLMHWHINGNSTVINVTGRIIDLNEYGEDWTTSKPILAVVKGFHESMAPEELVCSEEMLEDLENWVEQGIIRAFNSKKIQKRFNNSHYKDKSFTIASSRTNAGLVEDELRIVWTNDKTITPAAIRERQLIVQGRAGIRYIKKKRKP